MCFSAEISIPSNGKLDIVGFEQMAISPSNERKKLEVTNNDVKNLDISCQKFTEILTVKNIFPTFETQCEHIFT